MEPCNYLQIVMDEPASSQKSPPASLERGTGHWSWSGVRNEYDTTSDETAPGSCDMLHTHLHPGARDRGDQHMENRPD